MKPFLITHTDCLLHRMQPRHPERPERLARILSYLDASGLQQEFSRHTAEAATLDYLTLAHDSHHTQRIHDLQPSKPQDGLIATDPDTSLCCDSFRAALLAAGATRQAVTAILTGETDRAFCAIRPPGHHAEEGASMGFCLFNNIALGVKHALAQGVSRAAILDFDVHHGNGSVDIFKDQPEVLVCSSFQHPHYPNRLFDIDRPNIVNTPLPAGTGSKQFRQAIERDWLPALERHRPELIFVSAGFDAHLADPLGDLNLTEEDYRWITEFIVAQANLYASGRIVSSLEGGYALDPLARSVSCHLEALLQ